MAKSKITKILNSEEKVKTENQMENQKLKQSNEWITPVIFLTWYRHFHM